MKVVGTILYGSQNLRLDIPESDHDYKIVVTPNFDELYLKKDLNGTAVPFGDSEHYSCMDVRTFANNLAKGNPNAIEMLFSTEIDDSFGQFHHLLEKWREPYIKGYVASQWDYFTKAIGGIMYESFKRYGVTPKTASRALYLCKLVEYISKHNFIIDETILRNKEVCELPRAVRHLGKEVFCKSSDKIMANYHNLLDSINIAYGPVFNDDVFLKPAREFVYNNMGGYDDYTI